MTSSFAVKQGLCAGSGIAEGGCVSYCFIFTEVSKDVLQQRTCFNVVKTEQRRISIFKITFKEVLYYCILAD